MKRRTGDLYVNMCDMLLASTSSTLEIKVLLASMLLYNLCTPQLLDFMCDFFMCDIFEGLPKPFNSRKILDSFFKGSL